jgi:hypothetical protein
MMSAFAAQSDDPGWTRDAEERIERKLSGQLPESAIESVECRAQLCRLTTIHRSQQAVEGFQLDAFKDPDKRIWDADAFTFVESSDGDELVVVSYLAREGQSLPNR